MIKSKDNINVLYTTIEHETNKMWNAKTYIARGLNNYNLAQCNEQKALIVIGIRLVLCIHYEFLI